MALSLASGVPVGPFEPVEPINVLYCQEEGSVRGTETRLDGLIRTYKIPEEAEQRIFYAQHHRVKLDDAEWQRAIVAAAIEWNVGVAIFDALTYMHLGDENKNNEMEKVVETFQLLRKHGITSVVLVHLDKDRGSRKKADIDTQVRGGSIIMNAYDYHHALRRYHSKDAHIDLTVRAREQEEREYTVTWDLKPGKDESIDSVKLACVPRDENTAKDAMIARALTVLSPGKVYKAGDLPRIWGVGAETARWMRSRMEQLGSLAPAAGGFSLV
jgi:hypothetical protein